MKIFWAWAVVIILISIVLFILPTTPWLPQKPNEHVIEPLTDHITNQMYEISSVASFSVTITLALLSLAVPLLLSYFSQVIDGMQSFVQMIFNEMRIKQEKGPITTKTQEEIEELRGLYQEGYEVLKEAETLTAKLKPVFYSVAIVAVASLLAVLCSSIFLADSTSFYSHMVHTFNISIWLGFNTIVVLLILAGKGFSSERIKLLRKVIPHLDPTKKSSPNYDG